MHCLPACLCCWLLLPHERVRALRPGTNPSSGPAAHCTPHEPSQACFDFVTTLHLLARKCRAAHAPSCRAQQAGACPTVTTHTIQWLEAGSEAEPTCGVTDSGFGSSSQTGVTPSVTSGATGPTGSTGVTGTTDAYDSAPSEAP
jgi:hypothetical protein